MNCARRASREELLVNLRIIATAVTALRDPRWAEHVYTLGNLGSALIAIASGINNLCFGLTALGCQSLLATACEVGARMKLRPAPTPAPPATTGLLSV